MIYRRDPSIKIFDPNCAELFAECNFEGDSITVCDRIDSLPDKGWAKPIRSLTVPHQRVLKLYNEENLRGSSASYKEDQKCIEDINFSFSQIVLE
jgi:hypothetical protein